MIKRPPRRQELELIKLLLDLSEKNFSKQIIHSLQVSEMNDSGMGSLLLFSENYKEGQARSLKECIAEYKFKDMDNVEVVASLNIDSYNDLFELDIWKVDFSPLISLDNI
jgi:hypothetical protein